MDRHDRDGATEAARLGRAGQNWGWERQHVRAQGWGDSQPCTDSARIDVSDAQVGTKKQALRSNQETDEGKLRRPGQLLDKENPIQGGRALIRTGTMRARRSRARGGT